MINTRVMNIVMCCILGVLVTMLSGCGCGCNCPSCGAKDKFVSEQKAAEHDQHKAAHGSCSCASCKSKTSKGKKMETELRWDIVKEGSGDTPKPGQVVVVHYTGWLNEGGKPGRKFDSSVDRGQKFEFVIGACRVIKGLDQGVISMKKGEKRRLYIPSHLAYGQRGAGGVIPPNADLIFDVELFDIK